MHREEPRGVTIQPGEQEQYAAEQEELVAEAFENVVGFGSGRRHGYRSGVYGWSRVNGWGFGQGFGAG